MPAHIYEGLLVKKLLLSIADHLLASCLDTETGNRLDEFSAYWKFATLFHLSKVLVMLRPVFWV